MELSVVILNYKVRYFLEQCIRSVQRAIANIDAEIIVIDNDSNDGSCEMIRQYFPDVHLIENKENSGFSKANNKAVKEAKGKYVCILNPDTAVAEDCFVKALAYYKSQSKIGALGVLLMDGTGNFLPESKRNFPSPKVSFLKLIGKDAKYYANHVDTTGSGEVEVLVGAFMLLEREIYNEVGGFDEDYFMYGEDIDLSYKITKAGYPNHYLGETTVLHYKGESTKKDEAYYDRFYGAMQIFYKKHLSQSYLEERLAAFGVVLAKWASRNLKTTSRKKTEKLLHKIVISENEALRDKIGAHYQSEVKLLSVDKLMNQIPEKTLLVFDANYLEYSRIFNLMKQLSNRGNQFRIIPPKTEFLLGSDQSDEKGEVVLFSAN